MLTTPIVPNVRDVVSAVVGLIGARKTSEGRIAESLERGSDVEGTAGNLGEGPGAGESAQGPDVEGRDVQDGGWDVERDTIVQVENG